MYDSNKVEALFYEDRPDVSVASESELLNFCNTVREIGGGDLIGELLPSDPEKPNSCLVAKALNFNGGVFYADDNESQNWKIVLGDQNIPVPRYQFVLEQKYDGEGFVVERDIPLRDIYEGLIARGWDVGWIPSADKEIDEYDPLIPGDGLILPDNINAVVFAFDNFQEVLGYDSDLFVINTQG